ncbi:hypothetical protein DPMN_118181 [Dreissena polymorpha]|uniref:Uncharacterized protein n=1 Tax=Dreissena polymorpha TaxID=45954 RepID=A0A9D4GFY9_DREPO|nr:hypothetical protein DPMN_118181 [Dreissena polymorpha]
MNLKIEKSSVTDVNFEECLSDEVHIQLLRLHLRWERTGFQQDESLVGTLTELLHHEETNAQSVAKHANTFHFLDDDFFGPSKKFIQFICPTKHTLPQTKLLLKPYTDKSPAPWRPCQQSRTIFKLIQDII